MVCTNAAHPFAYLSREEMYCRIEHAERRAASAQNALSVVSERERELTEALNNIMHKAVEARQRALSLRSGSSAHTASNDLYLIADMARLALAPTTPEAAR